MLYTRPAMSSAPDPMSSASNLSPQLRPDDGEQENKTHAQISVSAMGLPADQLDIDLEMASTKVDRLATDTTREHHVSPDTDRPSGRIQQIHDLITEVTSRATFDQPVAWQEEFSGMVENFQTRRGGFVTTDPMGSSKIPLSIVEDPSPHRQSGKPPPNSQQPQADNNNRCFVQTQSSFFAGQTVSAVPRAPPRGL